MVKRIMALRRVEQVEKVKANVFYLLLKWELILTLVWADIKSVLKDC